MATATITSDQNTIVAEVFIAAPPARVFDAITDPKQRALWWGIEPSPNPGAQTGSQKALPFRVTEAKSDLRVGGEWSNDGVWGGTPFRLEGKYLEIDPPRLLVHTRYADFVGFDTVVRWELEPRDVHGLYSSGSHRMGTGTLLTVRHSGFAGHPEQASSHDEGWCISLGWLRDYIEKNETVETRSA